MSDDRGDPLREIWKGQTMHTLAPDIDTLRRCERQIEAKATRRNRIEYVAGGIVAVFLLTAGVATLIDAATLGSTITGLGHLAVAAGTLWVVYRLHRLQTAARIAAPDAPILSHLQNRLAAEREMLRTAWRWYVGPLVPGFVLIYGGAALEPEPNWFVFWTGTLLTVAIIGAIAWANRRAAKRVDAALTHLGDFDAA